MITVEDLHPGETFTAPNQGTNITPVSLNVTVLWVGPNAVHYNIEGSSQIKETTVERFLSIINQ